MNIMTTCTLCLELTENAERNALADDVKKIMFLFYNSCTNLKDNNFFF